jgi:hypothetical protein
MSEEQFFHESVERVGKEIRLTWLNARRHDVTMPLEGEYFYIIGIPTYLVRFRRLGDHQTPNYEAIKLLEEAKAQVKIELGGNELFGRFMPMATSSVRDIARTVRNYWQNDLLEGIDLDI